MAPAISTWRWSGSKPTRCRHGWRQQDILVQPVARGCPLGCVFCVGGRLSCRRCGGALCAMERGFRSGRKRARDHGRSCSGRGLAEYHANRRADPGRPQPDAEPEPEPKKPIEKIELPPDPQAEPVVAMPPPKPVEKPKEKKPKQRHASLPSMPSTADQQADTAGRADAGRLVAQL